MSRRVWLTHPNLTPAHDFKAAEESVGAWAACGWQVREDQSDPEPEPELVVEIPTVEVLSTSDEGDRTDEIEPETPAATTDTKGA